MSEPCDICGQFNHSTMVHKYIFDTPKEESMNVDANKLIMEAVKDGIANAVKVKIEGYNSPLEKTIKDCIDQNQSAIFNIINNAVTACILDDEFREEIKQSTRAQLARTLVQRIGGELEKQVNALKADPTTRARITVAIDTIVKDSAQ